MIQIPNNNTNKRGSNFHLSHEKFTLKAYANTELLPDRYVFVITNMCNLRCPFCFQKKEPNKSALKTSDWIGLASQIPEYGRVTLTGGEPLIFPGFRDVFSYVADRLQCNIISNGIALSEKTIDFLLSYPNFKVLSLSIDNVGNTMRNLKPNQWEHVQKMIGYFVKRRNKARLGTILDIKTIILDENADELFDIHRHFMEKLHPDTHMFMFLKGSPIQHADYMFTFRDIMKKSSAPIYKKFKIISSQLEKIREYDRKNGFKSFLHPKVGYLNANHSLPSIDYLNIPHHHPKQFLPCMFPWSSVHINFDGNVFPCLAVSMGNIKNAGLEEIWKGKRYKRFRSIIKTHGTIQACNRCGWIRPVGKIS